MKTKTLKRYRANDHSIGTLILLMLVLGVYLQILPVYSPTYSEGFENWNVNNWSNTTQIGGAISIPDADARFSGSYGAYFYDSTPPTSSTANIYRTDFVGGWEYYLDFYIYFVNVTAPAQTHIAVIYDNWEEDELELHLNQSGRFIVQQVTEVPYDILGQTWYRVTLGFFKDNSTGFRRVWINGANYLNQSSLDTDTNGRNITTVYIGCGTWATGNTSCYIDNITVSTTIPSFIEAGQALPVRNLGVLLLLAGFGLIFLPLGYIAQVRPKPEVIVKLSMAMIIGLALVMAFATMTLI